MAQPFFDPLMAYQQRRRQYNLSTNKADLELERERLVQDANLMRPYMERRFGQQLKSAAGDMANRGLTGSGLMGKQLGRVSEDQAFQRGRFERELARGQSDIDREISRTETRAVMGGAEDVRRGAGRASGRAINRLPF